MKKLLTVSLVLGMLVVFGGVASAQEVLVFSAPISFKVNLTKESPGTTSTTLGIPKTTLVEKTHTFTGDLVANVEVVTETGSTPNEIIITEVLFCGNLASTTPLPAELDFPNLATVVSDTFAGKGGVDTNVTVDIIGTGDFFAPPPTNVGINYFNASATGEFFSATKPPTLSKIKMSGSIAGGFTANDLTTDLTTPPGGLFDASFTTSTLVQNTSCTVAATCVVNTTTGLAGFVCTP